MNATARRAAFRMIEQNMAAAIHSGTGAAVEVTAARAGMWTTSGDDVQVRTARVVMEAAGLTLTESVFDDELGERFDYWTERVAA